MTWWFFSSWELKIGRGGEDSRVSQTAPGMGISLLQRCWDETSAPVPAVQTGLVTQMGSTAKSAFIHPLFEAFLKSHLQNVSISTEALKLFLAMNRSSNTRFHGHGHIQETNKFRLCPLQTLEPFFVCLFFKSNTPTMFLFNKGSERKMVRFAARATNQIKLIFYSLPTTKQLWRQTLV